MKAAFTAYCLYHIFERRNELSTTLRASRVFQQGLADTYRETERSILSCLSLNQNGHRVTNYTSLREYLGATDPVMKEREDWLTGRLFVLLTTFAGVDEYM